MAMTVCALGLAGTAMERSFLCPWDFWDVERVRTAAPPISASTVPLPLLRVLLLLSVPLRLRLSVPARLRDLSTSTGLAGNATG